MTHICFSSNNFGTFDDFGVKNDQVSHNMILMSKHKGQHGGRKGQQIRARLSPPPFLGNARKKLIFLLWGLPLKQGDSETNNESIDNACQKQDRALSKATNPTHCFHRTSYNSSPWRTLVGAIGFYNWFHVNTKLPFLLKILFSWSQCLMHWRHLAEGFQTAPYL